MQERRTVHLPPHQRGACSGEMKLDDIHRMRLLHDMVEDNYLTSTTSSSCSAKWRHRGWIDQDVGRVRSGTSAQAENFRKSC